MQRPEISATAGPPRQQYPRRRRRGAAAPAVIVEAAVEIKEEHRLRGGFRRTPSRRVRVYANSVCSATRSASGPQAAPRRGHAPTCD